MNLGSDIAECSTRKRQRSTPSTRRSRRLDRMASPYTAIGPHPTPTSATILPSPSSCVKCGATKFAYETQNFCCLNGDVHITSTDFPTELLNLFSGADESALHFQKYARLYNNMFAFSSLGGTIDCKSKKGIYVFKLHGQLYHYIGDLLPSNTHPQYLQLYFIDTQHENENRAGLFPQLRPQIIRTLMSMMQRNPYAQFFRSLREIDIVEDTRVAISKNPSLDQRVYNAPSSEEVAAILADDSNILATSPQVIVYGNSNQSHRVQHYYGCYDPLQYPLLHPQGESGWHQGIKRMSNRRQQEPYANPFFPISTCVVQTEKDLIDVEAKVAARRPPKEGKEVSCREYYAYKLQIRPGNYLLKAARLFQQYIVDMYVKIENTRLDFFRKNQSTIRADLYKGILDSINAGHNNASNIGSRTILPPSFIGGPRDIKRRYLNAMTLVQKYGKPDLFITITCNPNWPEIKEQLMPGERPEHRPDIIARIFNAKLKLLKDEIVKQKIFGPVAARVHVVEFQKRGLPHAHFLIILQATHKIKSPEDFDKYICAEIPDKQNHHLRSVVLKHMMHGPCGAKNPESPCMKEKNYVRACRFGYPKKFVAFTTCENDSYPSYRRRNNGDTTFIRGATLDNRWVIPYNPYLSAKFDCHINVEICSTIKAVKYLYKYVYKGNDRINYNITQDTINNNDEIQSYQSGRWISPPESAWRIFGMELYAIDPPVLPLQIHLPDMQPISFHERESLQQIVSNEQRSSTMLTEFFKTNSTNARDKLYSEYPEFYVWNATKKEWIRRQRHRTTIGRLAYVAPTEGERYNLRLLLLHVRGPTSFDALLTVNGHKYATFREAAENHGLLEQDGYAESCMNEAMQVQMPRALRRLFTMLLLFCPATNPRTLCDKYYPALSEDFSHQNRADSAKVLHLTCRDIERFLEGMGKSLKDYNLHDLIDVQESSLRTSKDINDALAAPIPPIYNKASKKLNAEQRSAYKCIMHHVKTNTTGAFFIDGPGGTGKTFLYCPLYAKVRSMGRIVLPTATSGIAASNIPTGRTSHSRFKISINDDCPLRCNVSKQSSLAQLLKETTLIIWDEASMAKKTNIEAVDILLQDICSNKCLFGGKIIVFGGDFRQVLPVLPRKTQHEAVDASLVSSYLWPKLIKFRLTKNMRAKDDLEFSRFLLELGNGSLQSVETGDVALPKEITTCFDKERNDFAELIDEVFPEIRNSSIDPNIFNERAILTPTNDDVDKINAALIDMFNGKSMTYRSFDTVIDDNCNTYPPEFLNTLCPAGMSPHELVLKKGCPVILLRNLDPASGLCNGTRLLCKEFFKNVIHCEISAGYYKGEQVFLPRITLRPPSSTNYPFHFERKQFPIKLCFAMTINKSQGQTLEQVALYLQQPCFSHGQLYVGLSRARTREKVTVFTTTPDQRSTENTLVKNVVSFEMLRRAKII